MVSKKEIETINLILKNAKINLILANNNLSYAYNFEVSSSSKINQIINRIKNLEDKVALNIKWIDDVYYENQKVEEENGLLINRLVGNVESINNMVTNDTRKSSSAEIKDIIKTENEDSKVEMVSNSKSNIHEDSRGIFEAATTVLSLLISLLSEKSSLNNKSDNKSNTNNNSSSVANTGSTSSTGTSSSSNKWLELWKQRLNKALKDCSKIVNSFTSNVKKYIKHAATLAEARKLGYCKNKDGTYTDLNGKKIKVVGKIPEGLVYKNGKFYTLIAGEDVEVKQFNGKWKYADYKTVTKEKKYNTDLDIIEIMQFAPGEKSGEYIDIAGNKRYRIIRW